MKPGVRALLALIPLVVLIGVLVVVETASSGQTFKGACVQLFRIPGIHPGGFTVGPDGKFWFTAQLEDKVGSFDQRTHAIRTWPVPKGTLPHFMKAGIQGKIWFTGLSDKIGNVDPRTGKVTIFSKGISPASVPHAIIPGPDGNEWFTEQEGGRIGEFDARTGQIHEYTKGLPPVSRPHGLTVDPDKRHIWFSLQNADAIARFDIATKSIDKIVHTPAHSGPHDIHVGPDNHTLFFTMQYGSKLGTYDLRTGKLHIYNTFLPAPTVGDLTPAPKLVDIVPSRRSNAMWISTFALGRFLRWNLDNKRVQTVSCGLPKGSSTLEATPGPDGHIWFTDPLGGHIGRLNE